MCGHLDGTNKFFHNNTYYILYMENKVEINNSVSWNKASEFPEEYTQYVKSLASVAEWYWCPPKNIVSEMDAVVMGKQVCGWNEGRDDNNPDAPAAAAKYRIRRNEPENLTETLEAKLNLNQVTLHPRYKIDNTQEFPCSDTKDIVGTTDNRYGDQQDVEDLPDPFQHQTVQYKRLLSTAVSGPGSHTLTLKNLSPDTLYLFQWWTNNSSGMAPVGCFTTVGGGALNNSGGGGGLGQHQVGTFKTPKSCGPPCEQNVTFAGVGTNYFVNGFQLRTCGCPCGELVPIPCGLEPCGAAAGQVVIESKDMNQNQVKGVEFSFVECEKTLKDGIYVYCDPNDPEQFPPCPPPTGMLSESPSVESLNHGEEIGPGQDGKRECPDENKHHATNP